MPDGKSRLDAKLSPSAGGNGATAVFVSHLATDLCERVTELEYPP
ncbi:hypothetical protein [Natrialba asiatica]|nr:hypothetical protein [Natrialba asiatica]